MNKPTINILSNHKKRINPRIEALQVYSQVVDGSVPRFWMKILTYSLTHSIFPKQTTTTERAAIDTSKQAKSTSIIMLVGIGSNRWAVTGIHPYRLDVARLE
jgi:hypothetical protein